jgi:site-specific recombinase XerD
VDILDVWKTSLAARRLSPRTIKSYLEDATAFRAYLDEHERGVDITDATRPHIEAWLARARDNGRAAATQHRMFRSLEQFYKWLVSMDEVERSPMEKMGAPKIAEQPARMATDDEVAKLIKFLAADKGFEGKRDLTIVQVLATTGVRSSEIMGMKVDDVDLPRGEVTVLGKGGRRRTVALVPEAADAMGRYLLARRRQVEPEVETLWLSRNHRGKGAALTDWGLRQMLERRCKAAGIDHLNPHSFRHRFAHIWRVRGGGDSELMAVTGWRSPQMLQRYGRSAVAERAREQQRRLFGQEGGDRL